MTQIVDDLLLRLGIDASKWKTGLAEATTASNSFIQGLKQHQAALAGLTLTSGITLASQVAFIKDVTQEYAKQEGATAKLESNLKSEQRTRADSVKVLVDQAGALQRITPFADEAITSMQATAAAFGLTDRQIEQLTPHVLDAAAGFRDVDGNALDLETVMKAVGKAVDGNSASLRKLGIDIKLTGDRTHDFNTVMDLLTQKFNGAAVAAGETFAGKMKIAEHQVSEVKEQIGAALAPALLDIANKVLPVIERFGQWASAHKDVVLAIVGGGVAGGGLLAALTSLGLILSTLGSAAGPIFAVVAGVSLLVGWIIKLKTASSQPLGDLGIDQLNEKITEAQQQVQKLIEYREKLSQGGPGLNKEQIASIFRFGSIDNAMDEVDKRITQARANLSGLQEQLGKQPKVGLEESFKEAQATAADLQKQIADITSGRVIPKDIGVLDSLILQEKEATEKARQLHIALVEANLTVLKPGEKAPAPTQTGPVDDAARAAALARAQIIANDKKQTDAWLTDKLASLKDEFEKETKTAEDAGKDTVAIEVKYNKAVEQARADHYAALRALHVRALEQEAQDRKAGLDQFTGPLTPDDQLGARVNASAGIKVTPDAKEVQHDWDTIIQISNDSLDEMIGGFTDGLDRIDERFAQTGERAAIAAAYVIANSGEMFAQFLTQMGNVENALGATIVITALEALKAVIRAYGEAEIAKATIGSFLSFGATLAAIGPIAAAMAAGIGVISAIESSFQKKNVRGSREMGGVIDATGPWLMHEGEIVYNPKKNTPADLVARVKQAAPDQIVKIAAMFNGASASPLASFSKLQAPTINVPQASVPLVATGKAGNGGFNLGGVNFTNYGPMRSDLDMKRAMEQLAALIMPMIPQGT